MLRLIKNFQVKIFITLVLEEDSITQISFEIEYLEIAKVISEVLERNEIENVDDIDLIKEVDLMARRSAEEIIKGLVA